ncbi:MAG: hypothetical protein IKI42_08005 [Clostridia bacterium]|nr:hypothetical protein [Clostridia bacterium]
MTAITTAILLTTAGCGPAPHTAAPEELEAANRSAARNEMLIGCWIPPRPHQVLTQEDADAQIAVLAASGINCFTTHHGEMDDIGYLTRLANAAEKNGIKMMIELGTDLSGDGGMAHNLDIVRQTMDLPAVLGYNLFDEPTAGYAAALKEEFRQIHELTGGTKLLMLNMLPTYGPRELMAPEIRPGLSWYRTYLADFLDTETDALSFDFYPYSGNPGGDAGALRGMLVNLSDMAVMAKKYRNVPVWGFLQDSGWAGMRIPGREELLLISHLHLIFGAESYSYFLYAEISDDGGMQGMLNWDGNTTKIYDRVKANNEHIAGMGYRFLSYSLKGFLTDNMNRREDAEAIDSALRLKSDIYIRKVSSDCDTLIGVFNGRSAEDNASRGFAQDPAGTGYYVLNYDLFNDNSVTLTFRQNTPYTVWGPDGIEAMGTAKTVTLRIEPGDARFVELKTFG